MSAGGALSVTVPAPAKLNLGLEVLGRRNDGYHDIRTILAMLEFGDHLDISVAGASRVTGVPAVDDRDNLIQRAIAAFEREAGPFPVDVVVSKRTPIAAGLGGASADAAATLLGMNALAQQSLDDERLWRIAASLGSDVPFFLGSRLALASSTGTRLQDIHPVPFDVLLVVPHVVIARKTARLYASLTPEDFSNGDRISAAATSLRQRRLPDRACLANAFERPLYRLRPDLADLRAALDGVESLGVGLSGAGPTHYVLSTSGEMEQLAYALRSVLDETVHLIPTHARMLRPRPVSKAR